MQSDAHSHHPASPPARRISVVGPSGSGKTILARALAAQLSLPLVELDPLRHAHAVDADFVRLVSAHTLDPAWIIDGHYRLVRDVIWRRADTIVWLNYSLGFVLLRLARRFAAKTGSASDRPSAAPRASWSRRFARLARTVRERREYRVLLAEAARRGATLVELRSDADTRIWRQSIEDAAAR